MSKLKEYWGYIAAGIGGLISLLLFIFMRRGTQINELKTKISLANTQKEADLIEAEIKHLQTNKDNLAHENKELDKTLGHLEDKRKTIVEDSKKLTDPKAVADYWNKN